MRDEIYITIGHYTLPHLNEWVRYISWVYEGIPYNRPGRPHGASQTDEDMYFLASPITVGLESPYVGAYFTT